MGRGIYLGVEGAGTNMSENGRLIVCTIIGWKIITLEIKGDARAPSAPPGYAPGYRPNMQLAALAVWRSHIFIVSHYDWVENSR